MLKKLLTFYLLCMAGIAFAQGTTGKAMIRLPITGYIKQGNDSITIVQVKLPAFSVFGIEVKTLGVLHHVYSNNSDFDTSMIGFGRCNLIKGDFYYFSLKINAGQYPVEGDLLSLKVDISDCFSGVLLTASKNHILFTNVEDKEFYNWQAPFLLKSSAEEEKFIKMMVSDVHYTGEVMLKQSPEANVIIKGGLFNHQKLFDAMQKIKIEHMREFLKYVQVRPEKYAGNTWKISEIFATWMVSETPLVKE